MQQQVYVIDNQNKSIEDFADLLQQNKIQLLIDVGTNNEIKFNSLFQVQNLIQQLNQAKIGYKYLEALSLHGSTSEKQVSTNYNYLQSLYYLECALDFDCKVALWIEDTDKTVIKDLQRKGFEIVKLQMQKLVKERPL